MTQEKMGLPQFNGSLPYAPAQVGLVHTQSNIMVDGMQAAIECSLPNHLLQQNPNYPIHLFGLLDIKSKDNLNSISRSYSVKFPTHPTLEIISRVPPAQPKQITTISVRDTSHLQPNQMYHVGLWGEAFMIHAVSGLTSIDIIRGLGTSMPAAIPKGTVCVFGGNTHEEGSMRPLPQTSGSTKMQSFSGISRNAWAMTGTARAIMKANKDTFGTNVSNEFEDCKRQHAFGNESKILLSQYSATRHNGMPMRTFSGLADQIKLAAPQNVVSIIGGMNYESLIQFFDSFITNDISGHSGSTSRIIYGDPALASAISKIGRNFSDLGVHDGTDMFGRRFKGFRTDLGDFTVYSHRLLEQQGQNNGMGFIVDPSVLELSYMPERHAKVEYYGWDTSGKLTATSDDNGFDGGGGVITSEFTMFNYNPASHGMMFGLNSAVCEDMCKRDVFITNPLGDLLKSAAKEAVDEAIAAHSGEE